jgi:hypothetical protein
MRKVFYLLAVVASLFVSCPNPSDDPGKSNEFVISPDLMGMVHAGNRSEETQEYALLDELGVHWMLTDFSWSSIQPAKDTWNLDAFKGYADRGESHGKKILAILDYDVGWIHDGTYADDRFTDGRSHDYISKSEIPLFCEYVKQTVTHYQDRVDAWCIWNEPNLDNRFWRGTREEFFELTTAAAKTIREVAPGAFIIGGAFNTLADDDWVRGIFTSGAMDQIDAIAYHPYMPDADSSASIYRQFKQTVADYDFDSKIWITEVGYPTRGSYGTEVSDERMPEMLIKTISLLATEGARHIFWYHFFDPGPEHQDNSDSEDWFGLFNHDFSGKNGSDKAYALCAAHIPGKTWRPSLPEREGIPNYIASHYFEGVKDNTLIVWNDRPLRTIQVKVWLPGRNRKTYDVATGTGSPLDEETGEIIISFNPENNQTLYFFTWENADSAQPPRISAP